MLSALAAAALAGAVAYLIAAVIALTIQHLLHHRHTTVYRWGAAVFGALIGLYAFLTSVGRN